MQAFVLGPEELDEAARRVARRWWWYVVAGIVVTVVGVLLLVNVFDAVRTLALLVAFALAIEGIDQIVNASRYRPSWPGYVLGALYLGTAAWAVAWPGITLWALAIVVGIGFLVTGIAHLVAAFRYHHDLPYRWVFVLTALLTVGAGVISLVWPAATILVLAIILGVRVTMEGLSLLAFGFGLRRVGQELA